MQYIDKKGIETKLIEIGFEKVSQTIEGCYVNRVNNISCFKSYDDKIKSHFVLAKGEERLTAKTINELLTNYNNLRNGNI